MTDAMSAVDRTANLTMKELPCSERPYERALQHGVTTLTDAELIAVLLATGRAGETAVQTAEKVLVESDGLAGLLDASPEELQSVPGIGPVKALRILAAVELGQRASSERQHAVRPVMTGPDAAIRHVEASMRYLTHEQFRCLLLDTRHRVIKTVMISKGGLAAASIHPRDVFREAVKGNAAAVILVHNHPSGDASPSRADIESTRRFVELGTMMGVPVVDHIIVGSEASTSFRRLGLC
ncbi:MAG: RadC family protein [Saccharofermentanales bacterium]|jgi:DNA repair protein RadC